MFLNGYPYTDFHEMNADFLIRTVQELKKSFANFTASNSLIFAEPLLHDLTKSYAKNTIVLDTDGNAYISLQNVPEGVQLANADYWLMVFNFEEYTEKANKNFTVNYFRDTTRAPYALAVGDWLVLDDVLYKVIVAIAADDLFEVDTNIVHFTIEQFLKDFVQTVNNTLYNYSLTIQQYKNDIDASELAYRNQLAQDIADTTASLQAQLTLAISGATVDSEVINARLGADGHTYSSLGNADRTQFGVANSGINSLLFAAAEDIYSKSSPDFDTVGYINPNGSFNSGGGGDYMRTRYINLENVQLIDTFLLDNSALCRFYFYDADYQNISGVSSSLNDNYNHRIILSRTDFPAGAAFIAFSALTVGNGVGYYVNMYSGITPIAEWSSNLNDNFDEVSLTQRDNFLINTSGVIGADSGQQFAVSGTMLYNVEYIAFKGYIHGNVLNIAFYDDSNSFISGMKASQENIIILKKEDFPSGAVRVAICGIKSDFYAKTYSKKITDPEAKKVDLPFVNDGFRNVNGNWQSSNSWKSTNLIPLQDVLEIFWRGAPNAIVANVSFFDRESKFINTYYQDIFESLYNLKPITRAQFPANAEFVQFTGDTSNAEAYIITLGKMTSKKLWVFGDSIMDPAIVGEAYKIADELHMDVVNFSHGNATASDYYSDSTNITIESPTIDYQMDGRPDATAKNVLSNQIRRALSYATNTGDNVTYTHPIAGAFTLDTDIWSGTGSVDNYPDVILIAIGINDGGTDTIANYPFINDSASVIAEGYTDLDRKTLTSAIRWAIETLQSKFPAADIYLANILSTGNQVTYRLRYAQVKAKNEGIKDIGAYCSVNFIDQFNEGNFNKLVATSGGSSDGVHPNENYARKNAKYIASIIKDKFRHSRTSNQ